MAWNNPDGLYIKHGLERAEKAKGGSVYTKGATKELRFAFTFDDLVGFTSDLNNDGTKNGFSNQDARIPLGAHVISARYLIGTAWTGTATTDLLCGLYQQDGTVIDLDGLMGATESDLANLTVGNVVTGAGADIGTQTLTDAYVVVASSGAVFTAGTAELVVEYIV